MASHILLNRLRKELADLENDPPPGIVCYPVDDDITELESYIKGPPDSPYEQGMFRLQVRIPQSYPFEPPQIRFKTRIYHPNIDEGGRICADILKKGEHGGWKPSLNLSTTLISLRALIAQPNPDDPLDADIAREYQLDRALFQSKAKEYTLRYAVGEQSKTTSTTAWDETQPLSQQSQNGIVSTNDMMNGRRQSSKSRLSLSSRRKSTSKPDTGKPTGASQSETTTAENEERLSMEPAASSREGKENNTLLQPPKVESNNNWQLGSAAVEPVISADNEEVETPIIIEEKEQVPLVAGPVTHDNDKEEKGKSPGVSEDQHNGKKENPAQETSREEEKRQSTPVEDKEESSTVNSGGPVEKSAYEESDNKCTLLDSTATEGNEISSEIDVSAIKNVRGCTSSSDIQTHQSSGSAGNENQANTTTSSEKPVLLHKMITSLSQAIEPLNDAGNRSDVEPVQLQKRPRPKLSLSKSKRQKTA